MEVQALNSQLEELENASSSNIMGHMTPASLNNPGKMLEIQQWVQQYSNYVGFESAMIKTIKDLLAGIVQKI